jgi:hypothetical protein
MEITDEIIREVSIEDREKFKPFAFFGYEGKHGLVLAFNTISDGYWDCANLSFGKMKAENHRNDVVDLLIYPLIFNYRHSIETYLKFMYFALVAETDDKKKNFLNLGHNLMELWNELKPYLISGKKHVGSNENIDAIEHYINELNNFDSNSMVMRYPIDKKLNANKEVYHFDYINFSNRMNELCESLRQLYDDLQNQMSEKATKEEFNKYINIFNKYRKQINNFKEILSQEVNNKSCNKSKNFLSLSDIVSNEVRPINSFLSECESDLLILLDNLYFAGRTVGQKTVRLAINVDDKKREFVQLCNELLRNAGLNFGIEPKENQINIIRIKSSALLLEINKALEILD